MINQCEVCGSDVKGHVLKVCRHSESMRQKHLALSSKKTFSKFLKLHNHQRRMTFLMTTTYGFNRRHFATPSSTVSRKGVWESSAEIPVLMTHHYPDLDSASDWLKQISKAGRPIRSTTQIWVVTRHQYGISALVSQTSFRGETVGGVGKCRLFSQPSILCR